MGTQGNLPYAKRLRGSLFRSPLKFQIRADTEAFYLYRYRNYSNRIKKNHTEVLIYQEDKDLMSSERAC